MKEIKVGTLVQNKHACGPEMTKYLVKKVDREHNRVILLHPNGMMTIHTFLYDTDRNFGWDKMFTIVGEVE